MPSIKQTLAGLGVLISSLTLLGSSVAAHVVVKPAEVVTAGFQTFTMGVPNEKNIPTTSIKLLIPSGLKFVSPTQKAGWQIDIEKEGSGEETTVKSITWSGGTVNVGFRDDFTFSAKVPDKTTDLQWKAYQTYQDGTVVAWDQQPSTKEKGEDKSNAGPFSVTKVVADTETTTSIKTVSKVASDTQTIANRAFYVGIAGIIVGLAAVFFATRKK